MSKVDFWKEWGFLHREGTFTLGKDHTDTKHKITMASGYTYAGTLAAIDAFLRGWLASREHERSGR